MEQPYFISSLSYNAAVSPYTLKHTILKILRIAYTSIQAIAKRIPPSLPAVRTSRSFFMVNSRAGRKGSR